MLLKPYRVLDLTTDHGTLCAQILGDMGADVIQIEPPGGAAGRFSGPFYQNREDGEHSLGWWGYSRGKRSIELDIDTDRDTFLRLVERVDFLIEAEPLGSMSARGIDYDALASRNPALIHVSLTPYGDTGPKAEWLATDLTLAASAGPLAMTGDEDRPPVRVSVPQVWNHASAEGAAGAMVALFERHQSGQGQHVVIAAQQAFTIATQSLILAALVNEATSERVSGGVTLGDIRFRLTYPALDGHVAITHVFGATVGPATRRLMEYVYEEGFCDEKTRDKDWLEYTVLLLNGDESPEEFDRVKNCVAACTATKTKAELLQAALERRLLLAPMTTIEDVVASDHFADRGYFVRPKGTGPAADIRYPGPFAKFSATPLEVRNRPPRLGEHTKEVLEELDRTEPLKVSPTAANGEGPLAGIKVLDLMWALAGPGATRLMADYGATVIRIESSSRLDVCRTVQPFMDGDPSPEKSALFHTTNAGKQMLSLDLTSEKGREVILDLVRWADVVAESYSPRAMKAFGLEYETLKAVNPDIIMLSTCLMGQTGPLAHFAGYGNLSGAIAGFFEITGWPDRAPAGPAGAYTDYIAPRYNAAAILAAIDHFRRTGESQHIDLSQAEAALHFLTPAILDYMANGTIQGRHGNADPYRAPHGVYPAAGEKSHIAIACDNDDQFQALCDVIPGLRSDDDLRNTAVRLARQSELDAHIAAFTATQDAAELEVRLQAAGVPGAMVQNSPELVKDPQLLHLGHFIGLPHQEGGQTFIERSRIHLSRTEPSVDASAPTFNRDMMAVLHDVLGYDDEKVGDLLVSGVLE